MNRLGCLAPLALVGAIGCATATDADGSVAPPPNPAAVTATSAVAIEAVGCSLRPAIGTGVIVSEPETVVTVAHTVAGAHTITVIDGAGERFKATVRFIDPASDVAVLQVDDLAGAALQFASPVPPVDGHLLLFRDEVPIAEPVSVSRRLDVTIEDIYIDATVQRSALEIEGPVRVGDSGGAVIVDGQVAGIIYAKSRHDDNLGFALDERELSDAVEAAQAVDPDAAGVVDPGACVP